MKRLVTLVVLGSLVLSGCGTVTTKELTVTWMKDAQHDRVYKSLHHDIAKTVRYLKDPTSTRADLHTLCSVLNLEIHAANDHLPTPDREATNLLADGYDQLATATTQCDVAGADPVARAKAIATFRKGFGGLYFGTLRLYKVLGRPGSPK